MIILVVALGAIIFALVTGSLTPYLQKTSLVAASAGVAYVPIDTTTAMPVFDVLPRAGEQFYLSGQPNIPGGSPSVSFVIVGPDGTFAKTSGTDISGTGNLYGKSMYIYRDQRGGGYWVTDTMQTNQKIKYLLPLKGGAWTIRMVDDTANVILNEMTVSIAANGSVVANPLAPTTIWTNTTDLSLTNSSGYPIPFTNYGVTPFIGPNGLQMFNYNGTGAYILGADNPDLTFTGDMSISLWMKPTTGAVTTYATSIVGKGITGDANDNYDMFITNGKLYMEWSDKDTGQMYHIETQAPVSWGSPPSLNYVTFTVASGVPNIYFAGAQMPINYYLGDIPGAGLISGPPPPVNLKPDNNPITIGKQNYPGAEFYYAGDMSEVSFYNRALTQSEITANNSTYTT
ncbi:MAG: LamG domain-containing protein [Methanoregula sp.]|nr:MAG: LamG domain-containing protein [Methanoregula sp.]